MAFNADLVAELEILLLFNLDNGQEGLKIHHDAASSAVAATGRLHDKGLITLPDGGYLTRLGHEAAEHAQSLKAILTTPQTR